MAWTWPTVAFFSFIAVSIICMAVWEKLRPGGAPRRGIFGIDTTRGDRLFISYLGSGFIHLAWLGILGTPLWGAVGVSLIFAVAVFKWV
jgi:predicted small integral membrane protein